MADVDLGTARGRVTVDASGAVYGFGQAAAAQKGLEGQAVASAATFKKTGLIMAGAGTAIVAGLGIAIKTAANFEQRLSAIQAVGDLTASQLDVVREKALQLGADTAFSASEAALAMEELIKAGLSVDDVMNGAADATVALAAAGEIELAEAATIASASMNQFKLEAEDMVDVADIFAGAANASATGVSEIGLAMSYVGPVANSLGLSLEDTAGAVALLSNNGIDANKAGTALRSILSRLQPVGEAATSAMMDLGLVTADGANIFFDAEGNIKSMNDIVGILNDSFSGLTSEQQNAYAKAIFGQEALSGVTAIAGTTTEEFTALQEAIGSVSAEDVAETKMDNLAGSIEELGGAVETLLIRAGTPLLKGVRGIVDSLASLVDWFANLSPEVIEFTGYAAAAAGVMLIVGGAALMLFSAVGKLKAGFAALKVALLANPIVLVVAGLVALGAALVAAYNHSETFRNIVDRAFSIFKDWIGPTLEAAIGWLKNLGDQLGNLWSMFSAGEGDAQGFGEILDNIFGNSGEYVDFFMDIYEAVATTFNWIKDNVIPIVLQVVDALGGWGNVFKIVGVAVAAMVAPFLTVGAALIYAYKNFEGFRKVVDKAIDIVIEIGKVLIDVGAVIIDILGAAIGWISKNIFPVFQEFGALVKAVIGQVISTIRSLQPVFSAIFQVISAVIRTFVTTAQTLWRNFGDNILNTIKLAWNLVKGVVEAALDFIKGVIQVATGIISGDWGKAWDGIKSIFSGVWNFMRTILETIIGAIILVIQTAIDTIISVWQTAWNTVKTLFTTAWNVLKTIVSGAINAVKNTISTGLSNIIDFFKKLPGRITDAIGNVASFLTGKGKDFIGGLLSGIVNKAWELGLWFAGLPGRIIGMIGDLGSLLLDIGKDLIQGLIDGVKDMMGPLRAIFNTITGLIPDWKGPPKRDKVLLYDAGQSIMEGFGQGIKSEWDGIRRLLGGYTSQIEMQGIATAATLAPPSAVGGGTVTNSPSINFSFPGITSASEAEGVRRELSDPGVLAELTRSIRAGVGRN